MTRQEYLDKRESYATSSAPKEVIEKAIAELDAKYDVANDNKHKRILSEIEESQADIDDIGD